MELWARGAVECFYQNVMSHYNSSRSLKDNGAESNVNCGSPAHEVAKELRSVSATESKATPVVF